MFRFSFGGWNQRQLLYSTVITNNGKNNKNGLALMSRVAYRASSSFQPAGNPSNAQSIDWRKNLRHTDDAKLKGPRGEWWWTGPAPKKDNLQNDGKVLGALPQILVNDVTEKQLKDYFDNTWLTTEVLFAGLQGEESFYRPPYHNLRHPMIFYYGHPSTFYTNKMRVAGLISEGIDSHFEDIFEVGVDEMRWDDISTEAKDWPSVLEVNKYRVKCHKLVHDVISEQFKNVDSMKITWDNPLWSLLMAIEHEKIHIETSSVLMRELPRHLLRKHESFPSYYTSLSNSFSLRPTSGRDHPKNELIDVNGGRVKLGKTSEADKSLYGWDNEYGSREIDVPDFKASKFKVSNGEFYEFVKSGGYREKKFWSEDGWGWRVFRNQKWPAFWTQSGPAGSHDYGLRTIFDEIEMRWDWPVIVNYHEASAFCNWKTEQLEKSGEKLVAPLRLVTEGEHHLLRDDYLRLPLDQERLKKDPSVNLDRNSRNNHLSYGSETPVDKFEANDKGFHDVFGNVWEWTEDDFNQLEGFRVHHYYDDFSSPCFDGEHKMILGGSFASCSDNGGNLFSRYHFRPHFHQHAGFRYVMPSKGEPNIKGEKVATFLGPNSRFSAKPKVTRGVSYQKASKNIANNGKMDTNSYETSQLLDQYLALHYGQQASNVDDTVRNHANRPDHALDFATRSGRMLADIYGRVNSQKTGTTRALDVGCAVGGATFKLAEAFDEVVGMDYSINFINKATEIRNMEDGDVLKFQVPVQGDIARCNIIADIPPQSARDRAQFVAGDATKLDELGLGSFDAVLCANLLCRLPDPSQFLKHMKNLVNKDGVVLFLSPYSWLQEFTAKDKWLVNGDMMSAEKLKGEMSNNGFVVVHDEDVPLIIREHERKYQYIISHGLAFKKEN